MGIAHTGTMRISIESHFHYEAHSLISVVAIEAAKAGAFAGRALTRAKSVARIKAKAKAQPCAMNYIATL